MHDANYNRIEDIAHQYEVSHGEVYGLVSFEKNKLVWREYGFFKGLFAYKRPIEDKAVNIVERYYRREVAKWK